MPSLCSTRLASSVGSNSSCIPPGSAFFSSPAPHGPGPASASAGPAPWGGKFDCCEVVERGEIAKTQSRGSAALEFCVDDYMVLFFRQLARAVWLGAGRKTSMRCQGLGRL